MKIAIEIVDLPIKNWWCSIVMLVYQRVSHVCCKNHHRIILLESQVFLVWMSMLFGLNPLKIKEDQKGKSPLFYAPNWIFNLLVTIKEKWIFHQQWWQNGDFFTRAHRWIWSWPHYVFGESPNGGTVELWKQVGELE